MIDGGGTIDGGGERWWAMWEASQHGDRDAAGFLSRERCSALYQAMCQLSGRPMACILCLLHHDAISVVILPHNMYLTVCMMLCCCCTSPDYKSRKRPPAAGQRCWSSAAARTWPLAGSPSSTAPGGRCTPSTVPTSGALHPAGSALRCHQADTSLRQRSEAAHAPQKSSSATGRRSSTHTPRSCAAFDTQTVLPHPAVQRGRCQHSFGRGAGGCSRAGARLQPRRPHTAHQHQHRWALAFAERTKRSPFQASRSCTFAAT